MRDARERGDRRGTDRRGGDRVVERRQVAQRRRSRRRPRRRRATASRNRAPPWTTRYPTASIDAASIPRRGHLGERGVDGPSRVPRRPRPADQSTVRRTAAVRSGGSRTVALSVADPGFRTRTRTADRRPTTARSSRGSRRVLAELARVGGGAQPRVDQVLAERGRAGLEAGHPVDDVHDEVEPVEVVAHDHVERRRDGPLLLVAADVEVGVVRPPVGQPVDQPRIAVVGEDDRLVGREQRIELAGPAGRADAPCRPGGASGRRR